MHIWIKFSLKFHGDWTKLNPTQKIKRIYDWSKSNMDEEELMNLRKDFVIFVDEHDKRRGTNFVKTFPELEELYYKIKNGN